MNTAYPAYASDLYDFWNFWCAVSLFVPVTSILPSIVAISYSPPDDDSYTDPSLAIIVGLLLSKSSIN